MMMEIKQENETKTPRRDGNNDNGTAVYSFNTHQTLDHNLQRQQQQQQQARSPNPDRATSVIGAAIAPISAGSNSKPPINVIRYRECLKNHAACIGGNIFDGCGEFMPSGDEGTLEALKCAACECHRNFHRKEIDGETAQLISTGRRSAVMLNPLQLPPPLPSPTMMHHHHHHQKYSISRHTMSPSSAIVAPMNVAFGGGISESSSEDLSNVLHSEGVLQHQPPAAPPPPPPFVLSKKRFRTKFTQEQKDKMMEFAEKVGWRFQKQDDDQVDKFCAEVGIKRHVFKVWMHNNKNNIVKNKQEPAADPV